MDNKKIYHVGPKGLDQINSLLYQCGGDESEAIDMFIDKWGKDAAVLAHYHINYIHCHDKLSEAKEHLQYFSNPNKNTIYEIDTTGLNWFVDKIETDSTHPVVAEESIPITHFREMSDEEIFGNNKPTTENQNTYITINILLEGMKQCRTKT